MALLPPALAHARCFCPTENSQPVHSDPLKSLLQPDGPGQAQMATAHQIACMVYYRLKDRVPSHGIGAAEYTKRFRERELQSLRRKRLGFKFSQAP